MKRERHLINRHVASEFPVWDLAPVTKPPLIVISQMFRLQYSAEDGGICSFLSFLKSVRWSQIGDAAAAPCRWIILTPPFPI